MSEDLRVVLTIKEAARYLKVSEHCIRNLIKKGEIDSFRVGRQHRIYADELGLCKK